MGLFGKLITIAIIVVAIMWAWNNIKIDTLTICVGDEITPLEATCVESSDCARYMTSVYGQYPDTPMYNYLLTQTTTCNQGKCEQQEFRFKDVCKQGETPLVYKVTAKELISSK